MSAEHITSRKNPLIAHIRKLQSDGGYRRACGEYLGDGTKLLAEALQSNAALTVVVATEGTPLPAFDAAVRVVTVPPDVMETVSPMRTPQGVLFLATCPETAPPAVLTGRRYLVLDGIQDPGNLGTICRTADAFGADGLFLLHHCADPWGHKAVRAGMGACFRLPVWQTEGDTLSALLAAARLPLYAADLTADAADVRTCDLTAAAVVIGSEGTGVSPSVRGICAGAVKIPMAGRAESLNAAIAASIILWEMNR